MRTEGGVPRGRHGAEEVQFISVEGGNSAAATRPRSPWTAAAAATTRSEEKETKNPTADRRTQKAPGGVSQSGLGPRTERLDFVPKHTQKY